MTDREVMQQALEALIDAANVLSAPMFADAVDALRTALEQLDQSNFCPRCGKRTKDIHTCTPPQEMNT